MARLLNEAPRTFRTLIVTNANVDSIEVVERVTEAGAVNEQVTLLETGKNTTADSTLVPNYSALRLGLTLRHR
ncbi:hypothetical protein [Legionella cherrii]|uniref:hypothetical protein n=1 Tax=Legionella cherrii TaxID=28084 RepID=UPI001ED9A185|nr:hypothetical protein [Legionella cherrii]